MNRFLSYTVTLMLFLLVLTACSKNDEKVEPKDSFDYELLKDRLTEPGVKYYENGKEIIFSKVTMNEDRALGDPKDPITNSAPELFLSLDNDVRNISIYWFQDYKKPVNETDTFGIHAVYLKEGEIKNFIKPKGIIVVDRVEYTKDGNMISIEGAFNFEYNGTKVKGVFKHEGLLNPWI